MDVTVGLSEGALAAPAHQQRRGVAVRVDPAKRYKNVTNATAAIWQLLMVAVASLAHGHVEAAEWDRWAIDWKDTAFRRRVGVKAAPR